jgi:uncharacterized membrane protein YphA (DoxX/SURF4 family)
MKYLVHLSRIFVGILFIISGFIKLNDPLGFAYKLQEYFGTDVLNIPFLEPYALMISIIVVIFEVVLGVFLLIGYKPKFTVWSLLIMIVFFTFLTFYSAYFDKVKSVAKTIQHLKPVIGPPNSTEEEAYHPEIDTKGAFLIHSLRGIIGDEVFFPMLKSFVSDERFTYLNLVNSNDFIGFVCEYTSMNLRDFFDFYFLGTELPKVRIVKKSKNGYLISLKGIKFTIPVEIKTSKGIVRLTLGSKPVLVNSEIDPEIDPKGWLLLEK